MGNIQLWRLRDDDFQTVVAIPKQLVVAKEEARAQRRSRGAKFGKNRLCRSAKRRAGQRLEINVKAAPSVPLPPFPNWITLHSPTPLAVFTGTTCSLKSSPTRRHVSCRTSQVYCERTGDDLCANGLHAAFVVSVLVFLQCAIARLAPRRLRGQTRRTQHELTSELPPITDMAASAT